MKPNMEFLLTYLQKHPKATFLEATRAAPEGIKIYPINYGRALGILGLATKKKKATKKAKPVPTNGRRTRGRPKQAGSSPVEQVIAHIQQVQVENQQLRKALEKIQAVVVELG